MVRRIVLALVCALPAWAQGEPEDETARRIAQLKSDDAKKRARAVRSLAKLDDPRVAGALRGALRDENARVRQVAAVALVKLEKTDEQVIGVLIAALTSDDWYTRWQACLSLGAAGEKAKKAAAALLNVAFDKELDISREAGHALIRIAPKDDDVLQGIQRLVATPELHADRHALLVTLERAGITHLERLQILEPLQEWLLKELHQDRHKMRTEAARQLARSGEDGVARLIEALKSDDRRVRAAAALGLGQVEHKDVVDPLAAKAGDEDARVREAAVRSLAKQGKLAQQVVDALVAALEDKEIPVRDAALAAITQLGKGARRAIPALLRLLGTPDEELREGAKAALEKTGTPWTLVVSDGGTRTKPSVRLHLERPWPPDVLVPYDKLLSDLESNDIGPELIAVLRSWGSSDALLRRTLDQGLIGAREIAAFLLGRLARDKKMAEKALTAALRDPSPDVRNAAKDALKALEEGR